MAKTFNSKECQREFDRYRKKVARLNAYINDVIKKVGNNEVYLDKSSTIISAPASVWPIEECRPEPGKEFCEFNGMPSLEFPSLIYGQSIARTVSHVKENVR